MAYQPIPRASEDSNRDASPHEYLLPTANMSPRHVVSKTWSADINPVLLLRVISTALAITMFALFVVDGYGPFIAADVFGMMIILVNIVSVLNHVTSNVFKVTVQFRNQTQEVSLRSQHPPRIAMYFDVGLAICLFISNMVGASLRTHHWWGGAWRAGSIIAYIVIGLQLLLAIPQLANKHLILTAKLSDLNSKPSPDFKFAVPAMANQAQGGSPVTRVVNTEQPRQPTENLV